VPGTGQDGLPVPPAVEVAARHVVIDGDYAMTLAVTGYPAEVAPGWLEPLTSYPGRLDVALHIEPVPAAVAADRLRRQRARLESSRRTWAGQGRLDDPQTEAAADDARTLAYQVARGEGKLFRLGLYLTVHGEDPDDLAGQAAGVRALADSLLLSTAPATYRSLQGWVTTLPAGTDALKLRRTMDTAALAAAFPFSSPDLPRDPAAPDPLPGVLYGASASGPGLVAWDRWACDNHNSVTLATSGAGKSYLGKLEISRQLYTGTECWVVDPEDEYARLCAALGGTYIHLGAPGVHLNPLDLPDPATARPDALTRRALFAHTVIAVLTGSQPAPAEKAALDKAIMAAYHHAGITADQRTWAQPAPLLGDLAAALRADGTPPAVTLADRLIPYTSGTHAALFSAATTTRPAGHLVVFSLRDLPDELKAIGTLLALDATWRRVSDPAARGRRRLITVDEAWLLMRDPEGARFLFRMAKASRKHHAGLAAITQDAEDVLATDLGRAVIANSATQILLRQSPQAIAKVTAEFRLSAGERSVLLAAARGTGLLAAGPSARVSFEALASPEENAWCTSDPAEIARMQASQPAAAAPAWPGPDGWTGEDGQEDMLP
jgi:type IV secretory pathway VirB4 component